MPNPNSLALYILDCHCRCGHTWTHSYPVLTGNGCFGGAPSPQEEFHFQVTRLIGASRHYQHCHRCAPLGLGIGWEAPQRTAPRTTRSVRTIEDLDKEIF